jgi:hypothetical protein
VNEAASSCCDYPPPVLYVIQGRDTLVRYAMSQGRIVPRTHRPRTFVPGHIGRGHIVMTSAKDGYMLQMKNPVRRILQKLEGMLTSDGQQSNTWPPDALTYLRPWRSSHTHIYNIQGDGMGTLEFRPDWPLPFFVSGHSRNKVLGTLFFSGHA